MTIVRMHVGEPKKLKKCKFSIFVSFDYNPTAVRNVKNLPQEFRKYDVNTKVWEVDPYVAKELLNKFEDFNVEMTGYDLNQINSSQVSENTKEVEINLSNFKTTPFDYQLEGIKFGLTHDKFLLGDEQGLGKTMQAIQLAVARKHEFKHCLIVCGVNSVKYNWLREIEKHSNEKAHILGMYYTKREGKLRVDGPLEEKLNDLKNGIDEYFIITNIETLKEIPKSKKVSAMSKQELTYKRILDKLEKMTLDGTIGMVIIDEVHKAKNHSSRQGKGIHRLKSKYKMALTGTPIMNNPLDLYNVLKWLGAENHSFTEFKNFYCNLGGFMGSDVVGYKNLDHLKQNLDRVMLRRLKEDNLDLPEKISYTEYVDMKKSQEKLYTQIVNELIDKIEEIELSPNPLAMLTRLRQVTSYPQVLTDAVKENAKLERLDEMLEEIVDNGKKAIIFSNWSKVTQKVKERYAKYNPAYIDGSTVDRMDEVERFQNDDSCKVIIGTIGAMGTGLTLTAASTVFFIDKPWTPAEVDQASDRAHRIGTKENVNIVTLAVRESVDEKIENLLEGKRDIASALVDGKANREAAMELVRDVLGI